MTPRAETPLVALAFGGGRNLPDDEANVRENSIERLRDYATLSERLNGIDEESMRELLPALQEARDEFLAFVRRALRESPQSPEWVNALEFDPGHAFSAAVERMFGRAWAFARDLAFERHYQDPPNLGRLPESAQRYFRTKRFWVAGLVGKDATRSAQSIILAGMKSGASEDTIAARLAEAMDEFTGARLRTIVRTNVTDAYNQGVLVEMRSPDMEGIVKAVEYVAVLDDRTTEVCEYLDGTVFRLNDRRLDALNPPNHFNALAEGTSIRTRRGDVPVESVAVGDEVLTHRGRWRRVYATMSKRSDGDRALRLDLSTGGRLLVTHEHPVLTARGWKPAGDLEIGDELFEHREQLRRGERVAVARPDHYPSLFDEPAVAWESVVCAPSAAVYLQRDQLQRQREIDDVGADRVLVNEARAEVGEHVAHEHFVLRSRALAPVLRAALCCFVRRAWFQVRVLLRHAFGRAARPLVGFLALTVSPVLRAAPLGHDFWEPVAYRDLLFLGADRDSVAFAPGRQRGFAEPEFPFDAAQGLAPSEVLGADQSLDAAFVSKVHGCSPSVWVPSTIIAAIEIPCKRRVFNLAVEEDETYLAEGVVVHNCRSVLSPVVEGQRVDRSRYINGSKFRRAQRLIPPGFGGTK